MVLNDRPGSADLTSSVQEIQQLGVPCHGVEADIFDRKACEQLFAAVERIDILISNPAFSQRGDFVGYDPELFEKVKQGKLSLAKAKKEIKAVQDKRDLAEAQSKIDAERRPA